MARPPSFTREAVVERAMEVFWREDFHGASIAQLGAAMGLRPGSIYAAFGSKEGLFREALAAYTRQVRARARALQLGPRALLERWFTLHIDRALAEAGGRGCLLLNSVAELPRLDDETVAAVRAELDALERLFHHCVASVRRQTPRPDGPSPTATARLLVAALIGIGVMSRAGAPRRTLRAVAHAALAQV